MNDRTNIFINKKILIYGLGKSGISSFNFLKGRNQVFLFDDNKNLKFNRKYKNSFIPLQQIKKFDFDIVLLSPGIDINNCKLSNYLKCNLKIIYTDLDVFYSFYGNKCITITGTNGKSTTCQLLFDVLKEQKYDVKLAGNIGYPILSIKNIKRKTIFVIEASSYQLEYSQLFRSKYAAILNISPDHLERHGTIKKYVSAKFKLLKNQKKNSIALVNKYDKYIQDKIITHDYNSRVIQIDTKIKISNLFKNKL